MIVVQLLLLQSLSLVEGGPRRVQVPSYDPKGLGGKIQLLTPAPPTPGSVGRRCSRESFMEFLLRPASSMEQELVQFLGWGKFSIEFRRLRLCCDVLPRHLRSWCDVVGDAEAVGDAPGEAVGPTLLGDATGSPPVLPTRCDLLGTRGSSGWWGTSVVGSSSAGGRMVAIRELAGVSCSCWIPARPESSSSKSSN